MKFLSGVLDRLRSLPRLKILFPFAVVLDWGAANKIVNQGKVIALIRVSGTGNIIEFGPSCSFKGRIFIRGNNNRIVAGKNCRLNANVVVKGKNQTVSIGDQTTFVSVYLLCIENKDVSIGRWCMFSRNIEIRTSDAHALIDAKKRIRLNPAASVKIGNHVWVGVGALISKGAEIADDSVVGAKSFVNKAFLESNVVIAGAPAKIIKHGVTWNRGRKAKYRREALDFWRQPDDEI